jgi:hypothetical protein
MENQTDKLYSISATYLTKLLDYLARRPYHETANLILELQSILQAQTKAEEEMKLVEKEGGSGS